MTGHERAEKTAGDLGSSKGEELVGETVPSSVVLMVNEMVAMRAGERAMQ